MSYFLFYGSGSHDIGKGYDDENVSDAECNRDDEDNNNDDEFAPNFINYHSLRSFFTYEILISRMFVPFTCLVGYLF